MRYPESITHEIQCLDKLILNSKELSNQFPEDNMLRLSTDQYEFRKTILVSELNDSLAHYGQHSLKYVFEEIQDKIKLETLTDSLSTFKGLIDKTIDKVTNGANNHLPVYFNTVFSGSYGIQLTTPFEEKLFDHNFEKAIDRTITVVSELMNSNEENLKENLEEIFGDDRKMLNRYSLFFKKIHQSDEPVRIEWKSPITKVLKTVSITPPKAKLLYQYFTRKEERTEQANLSGTIKGLSLLKFKIEFENALDKENIINAKFNEDLADTVKSNIDKKIVADFDVKIKYNESKNEEEKSYELISIHPFNDKRPKKKVILV
ncbi:MAG: hypothetical protein ACERIH_00185 [Labilibaculum antarcticum]